ncbi:Transcriptional regulator, LysR family [hydrothermal vent metagenome]|uniref:Transcriptional regulator, LysR family n=1 Tax=hydrothermal vent metagenome TaxID=652676 RepID=A0A3B0RTY8_9ZZZZ
MGQLEDMDTFVRIVDAGSISQAAIQLGIVKSAVSRRLTDLEVKLGVQLLNRTTRKSSPTEAGQQYYEKAVQILDDVVGMDTAVKKAKTVLTGRLKISAPLSFGLQHLAPVINEFVNIHPDLTVHMDFNDQQVGLINEGYDIAIRIAELGDSSLMARKLAPIRRILCASPAYIEKMGMPEKPADLKHHHILHYTNARNNTWHLSGPGGSKHVVTLQTRMVANNGDFLKDAALFSHGITMAPTFIVWKELAAGALVTVMDNYRCSTLDAYAIYPQTRHLPHKQRKLIDFLVSKFNNKPYWDANIA